GFADFVEEVGQALDIGVFGRDRATRGYDSFAKRGQRRPDALEVNERWQRLDPLAKLCQRPGEAIAIRIDPDLAGAGGAVLAPGSSLGVGMPLRAPGKRLEPDRHDVARRAVDFEIPDPVARSPPRADLRAAFGLLTVSRPPGPLSRALGQGLLAIVLETL